MHFKKVKPFERMVIYANMILFCRFASVRLIGMTFVRQQVLCNEKTKKKRRKVSTIDLVHTEDNARILTLIDFVS